MKFRRSTNRILLLGVSAMHLALTDPGRAQSFALPASPYGLLPGEFVIRTYLTNNYLTARDGGRHSIDAVITSATAPGPNEKFKLTKIGPDYTALQTLQGYYVSAVGGGGLGGNFAASEVLQT